GLGALLGRIHRGGASVHDSLMKRVLPVAASRAVVPQPQGVAFVVAEQQLPGSAVGVQVIGAESRMPGLDRALPRPAQLRLADAVLPAPGVAEPKLRQQ